MEIQVNDANFEQEVTKSDIPCLIDFWAPWCGPCLMVGPVVEEIAKEYEGKLKVCKVNVDESPGIATQYRIMSIPTIMLFKNGEVADKVIGALPKENLISMISPHI